MMHIFRKTLHPSVRRNSLLYTLQRCSLSHNSTSQATVAKKLKVIHHDQQQIEEYEYQAGWKKVQTNLSSVPTSFTTNILQTFYPKGYPHSVAPGYNHFMKNQMISAVLSSAGGIISMNALLSAVGLSTGVLPLSAALSWLLKDGLGQFGGILFASLIHVRFDQDPKKWRWISSLSLELSNSLEMLTLFFPQFFIVFASIANIGKNISFLAAGASRAAIHKSFAQEENLADVTAKTGSQNIFSSMIGTSLGISLVSWFGGNHSTGGSGSQVDGESINAVTDAITSTVGAADPSLVLPMIFASLSASSLVFSYRALKPVVIKSLTADRLDILIHHYFRIYQVLGREADPVNSSSSLMSRHIFTPEEVQRDESVLGKYRWSIIDRNLLFELPNIHYFDNKTVTLNDIFRTNEEYENLQRLFQNDNYVINALVSSSSNFEAGGKGEIYVLYKEGITNDQIIRASIQAYYIRRKLHELKYYSKEQFHRYYQKSETVETTQRVDLIEESFKAIQDPAVVQFVQDLTQSKCWHTSNRMIDRSGIRLEV